ncbi:ATP-binding protein [Synoicihabitans lomoniglobus]|uniref:Sensory/regulatory protein RpfC n=1 Tax=Synoicihabitans lomoniglobus TaxID=2909285 RepID=A0AAE9ZZG1_9BACT|nr:ATP-binding protein [Opitutaceae bacterium LMO-M01]WED65663.1 ATP-binding protein [Opitutaceae bacterium LMO-M01]
MSADHHASPRPPLAPASTPVVLREDATLNTLRSAVRLAAVERLQLKGAPTEPAYERHTRLASQFLNAPASFATLIGATDQHVFASCGDLGGESAQALGYSQLVVTTGSLLIVDKTHPAPKKDELNSTDVAAYLGYPIRTPDGFIVGVFGAMDTKERVWAEEEIELMHDFNELLKSEIGSRYRSLITEAKLEANQGRLSKALGWADCLVWEAEVDCTTDNWAWRFNIQPSGLYKRLFGSRTTSSDMGLWYRHELPDQAAMDQRSREALLTGKPGYMQEFRVVEKGKTFWLRESVTITPLGQKRHWVVGVATDITMLKELEANLAHARDEALKASQLKSQFLANMSHEIRTPMNGIIGTANMLMDSDLNDAQRQMGRVIQESGESLLVVINDILDISKIEAGMLSIETAPFSLSHVIGEVMSLLQPQATDKGINLKCEIDANLPTKVVGDAYRVRQIVTNLLGNAIKFTAEGEVAVHVATTLRASKHCAVRITISDTGFGISTEDQSKLFLPFVQIDGSDSRQYGGTGLGLAISRQLTELMGGHIGLRSTIGTGSTFWLELPFLTDANPPQSTKPAKRPQGPAAETSPPVRTHLLLVEDNKTNQFVAQHILKKIGFTHDVANHGEEALALLARNRYDAVLMDCQMPVLDGFETTRRIREGTVEKLDPSIPIVALTAYAMIGDEDRCREAGMNGYVTKPIRAEHLRAALQEFGILSPLDEETGQRDASPAS